MPKTPDTLSPQAAAVWQRITADLPGGFVTPATEPTLCASLRSRFGDDAIRVMRVHAKFALLEDDKSKICLQTSANLNTNPRIENVSVSSCPVFFDAYSQLVESVFSIQQPSLAFNDPGESTRSFQRISAKTRRKTVPNPWLTGAV